MKKAKICTFIFSCLIVLYLVSGYAAFAPAESMVYNSYRYSVNKLYNVVESAAVNLEYEIKEQKIAKEDALSFLTYGHNYLFPVPAATVVAVIDENGNVVSKNGLALELKEYDNEHKLVKTHIINLDDYIGEEGKSHISEFTKNSSTPTKYLDSFEFYYNDGEYIPVSLALKKGESKELKLKLNEYTPNTEKTYRPIAPGKNESYTVIDADFHRIAGSSGLEESFSKIDERFTEYLNKIAETDDLSVMNSSGDSLSGDMHFSTFSFEFDSKTYWCFMGSCVDLQKAALVSQEYAYCMVVMAAAYLIVGVVLCVGCSVLLKKRKEKSKEPVITEKTQKETVI